MFDFEKSLYLIFNLSTPGCMRNTEKLPGTLKKSALWTALLTLLFLLIYGPSNSFSDMGIALPYFVVFYFFFFSVGNEAVSTVIHHWIDSDIRKVIIFPFLLIGLYFSYVLLNGQNPYQGTLALVPYLIFFPVLLFAARRRRFQTIDWLDFAAFVIYLLPTTLIEVNPVGNLPFNGEEFDSIYRIILILAAVYAFGTIRGLAEIGFFPVFSLKFLWTAIWVWFLFYLFVVIVGYPMNFIKFIGHGVIDQPLLKNIAITVIATFFHTAIFEELFFRGILQNMITKRIGQAKTWKIFWYWGLFSAIPLALLVGYTLKGGMPWFPALMTVCLFGTAFYLEKAYQNKSGVYTALAITSVIFGLVHYHSHAIIFIGFACVAGWAYGYTYLKTKNVFYSALVHTLVNSSVLIFGFEFFK